MAKFEFWMLRRSNVLASCVLLLFVSLVGCQRKDSSGGEVFERAHQMVPAGITGINHTGMPIVAFYVNDAYGGNIPAKDQGGGGGTVTCCLSVPSTYVKGLKVRVRWNASTSSEDQWQEKLVELDPYSEGAGNAWVNFLPSGDVRIIVTNENLWGSTYDGPFKAPSHPTYQGTSHWALSKKFMGDDL